MNPEQAQRLEDIKQEIRDAAQAIRDTDTAACCNRLVDAFLMLTEYLESLED